VYVNVLVVKHNDFIEFINGRDEEKFMNKMIKKNILVTSQDDDLVKLSGIAHKNYFFAKKISIQFHFQHINDQSSKKLFCSSEAL
jgi:hypothetical protein